MISIKIWLLIALGSPALLAWIIIGIFKDALITIGILGAYYYGFTLIYSKFATEFDWKIKLAPEAPNLTEKNLKDGKVCV